jgi:hypothetical protein
MFPKVTKFVLKRKESIVSSIRVAHVISERATGYGHFGNEGNLKVTGSPRHQLTASKTTF